MKPHVTVLRSVLLVAVTMLTNSAWAQYAVGTADVTYADPARGGRSVPVNLYYPSTTGGVGQPVASPPEGGFGAVAFGHGFLLSADAYAWIAERLAASGCVVAVPRTGGELFPDHQMFALDLAFAARTLRDANLDPASPFFGRMSPHAVVMGHSMGGGCSLLAAAADPSLTAVANFAAAETTPSAIATAATLDRPVLLFSGTNDCVTPPAQHQIPMYEALAGWRTRVTISGASHCQFNASSLVCSLGESCAAGITRPQQQDAVWWLLEPWVRWVVLQEPGAGVLFQDRLSTGGGFSFVQSGGAADAGDIAPRAARMMSAVPNPFNPSVEISAAFEGDGPITLEILDLRGRRLRLLDNDSVTAGIHRWRWDGRDDAGRAAPGGSYVARLRDGAGQLSAKLTLLR